MPITRPITRSILSPLTRAVTAGGGGGSFKGFYSGSILASDVLPFGTAAINESTLTGATTTRSVDTAVTFGGQPTTKVVVGAGGTSTFMEAGTSSASINLSDEAQQILSRHLFFAVKADGANVPTSVTLYLGDGTYANFRTFGTGDSAQTADGWTVFERVLTGATSTTGTPIALNLPQRAKLRVTFSANVVAGNVWFAAANVVPKSRRTVVFTCDDGYDEWEWLVAQAKLRGIPISFGIASGLANSAGYLTSSQIQTIANDASGLFEMTNHARLNDNYVTLGLAAYVADVETCRTYLTGLGLDPYAASIHQYVQGFYDQTLIDDLQARGFYSAREVGAVNRSAHNAAIAAGGEDLAFRIPATCNLDIAYNLATVQSQLTQQTELGTAFIMGHKFEAAAGALTWINGYDANYGVLNLLDWLADKRNNEGWQIMKWSDWSRRVRAGSPVV